MEDKRSSNKRGGCVCLLLALLAGLPPLYVFSLGPAVLLLDSGMLNEDLVQFIYVPLQWLADHNEFVEAVLQRYVHWWVN